MIQESLPANEIYALTFEHNGETLLGGWGLQDENALAHDEVDHDRSKLRNRTPYWAVSVPGESEWIMDVRGG